MIINDPVGNVARVDGKTGGSFINARNITGTISKEVVFIGGATVTDIGDFNNLTEKGVIFH